MYRKSNQQNMSELEQEFELEMDDNETDDFETDDFEMNDDSETDDFEFEAGDDSESDDYEMEYGDDSQGEYEWLEPNNSSYGERFFELSQREFESESEIDEAVNEILDDMEREYFLGGIFKGGFNKLKNAARKLAQKGIALAKKAGINLPSIEALKSMLGPVAGLLKGNLGALIKPALKAALMAHPAGMAALPALKALGFESSEDMGENREAWNNYASVAQEAFEYLAANINENADNPLEASRLATNAFQAGLKNVRNRRGFMPNKMRGGNIRKRKVRRIYIHPGETLVIRRKGRSL
jgi:hypothetical protein